MRSWVRPADGRFSLFVSAALIVPFDRFVLHTKAGVLHLVAFTETPGQFPI